MATKSAPQLPKSDAGENDHIPTLPFGTRSVVAAAPRAARDSRVEREPFRFVMRQEQIAATLQLPGRASGPAIAPVDPAKPSLRSRWILPLGALVLAAFACTLLIWPETPNGAQAVTLPRGPAPTVRHAAQVTTQTAAFAQAAVLATRPANPAAPPTLPSRAPDVTSEPQAPPGARLTILKARSMPKRQSVLASVLAPPPAD